MYKHYIIIFFSICLTYQISAQNPGFLGKKFSLYYDFVITPSFGKSIPYDASEVLSPGKLNFRNLMRYRHEIDLEYAVARNWGVGVDYFHHRGGYGPSNDQFANQSYIYDPFISRNFKRNGFGVFVRKYTLNLSGYNNDEGALAPLGYYLEGRLFMSFDKYQIKANSNYFNGNDMIFASRNLTRPGASIKLGAHLLLFDRFILDFGVETGYVFPTAFDDIGKGQLVDIVILESTIHPYDQILAHHLFGFHLGIGYILF